jgi:predicted dehydrogenase
VSGSPDKSQKLAQQYGIASKNILEYRNYDRLADIAAVQVVYIALPNSMHAEYSIRAAKAGKHVLCEKPMAINPVECEQMIEASDRATRKLMIAYRIQYEPHNRAARDFVRTARFGQVKYIESFNGQRQGDPDQWRLDRARSGGGSLVDLGIYCLNTIRFLLGEEPVEVSATIHSPANDPRFRSVEDLITFNLRFPSGVLANCASSYDSHNSKRYRVFATEGWFGLDPAFPYRGLEMQTARVENKIEHIERPQITSKNQFATELDHMADCVMNNVKPFTPGEEGLQDQRIMNAIYESAEKGTPVKLRAVEGKDFFRGPEPKW